MSATVNFILDKRRIKKTSKYPIKLQVSFKRSTIHYQTIFDLSDADFNKLSAPRINEDLQTIRDRLKDVLCEVANYLTEMHSFNFYEFESDFISNQKIFKPRKKLKAPEKEEPNINAEFDYSLYFKRFPIFKEDQSKPGSISIVYLSYIKLLLQQERIGTALSYQGSYNSIKKFRGNVCFTDITVNYLIQYEQWMKNQGVSRTSIGIRLRPLRAMFNEANEMGIIKKEKCYPFGRRRYRIPTGRNIKKALRQDYIKELYYFQPNCINQRKALDFWLFCYFGNGMNIKDVAHLKYKNIEDGYLIFTRAKTDRTTLIDSKPIVVFITEDMHRIIDKWGNKDKSVNNYIFPIMDDSLNPLERYELVPIFTLFINDNMKKIGQQLGFDKKVTTIVCRHSFSTQLKRSGVSTEFIQEALGHTNKKTTENYLDSFDNAAKKEYASMLTAFKNSNRPE